MGKVTLGFLFLAIACAILDSTANWDKINELYRDAYFWAFPEPEKSQWDLLFELIDIDRMCSTERKWLWHVILGPEEPADRGYLLSTVCYLHELWTPEAEKGLAESVVLTCHHCWTLILKNAYRLHLVILFAIKLINGWNYKFFTILLSKSVLKGFFVAFCSGLVIHITYRSLPSLIQKLPKLAKRLRPGPKALLSVLACRYTAVKLIHSTHDFHTFHMTSRKTQEDIFMKCLRKGASKSARKLLAKEYRATKAVNHPNIVRFIDWVQINTTCSLGLEFALFGNLKEAMLSQVSRLRSADKFVVFRQIVSAIDYLHSLSIAHLNIRPGSILVFDQWSMVKLSGFDHCKKIDGRGHCTLYDLHPIAIPAEVIKKKPYDPVKADVWALGSVFFYILSGDYFQKDMDLPLHRIVLPSLPGCDISQKRGVLQILGSLLSYDPSRRPETSQILVKFKYLGQ